MERGILLLGGGGHCRSVIDSLIGLGIYKHIGIVDPSPVLYMDIPYVGTDEDLPTLYSDGWTDAFITLGSIGESEPRKKIYEKIKAIGFWIPSIVDTTAILARNVDFGEGVYVGKRAVINSGAQIGTCAIINTGAIVEHDCLVGKFSHISPGAVLCGESVVGEDTHIGAGSVIRQQIRIGEKSVVGMGSVVTKEIPAGVKAYGNPCRIIG